MLEKLIENDKRMIGTAIFTPSKRVGRIENLFSGIPPHGGFRIGGKAIRLEGYAVPNLEHSGVDLSLIDCETQNTRYHLRLPKLVRCTTSTALTQQVSDSRRAPAAAACNEPRRDKL
ncbi:hypothetical protein ACJJTC_009156 [Scirpophaga incertulas]